MTPQLITGLVLLMGMAMVGGVTMTLAGARRTPIRLADSLALLDGATTPVNESLEINTRSDRLGAWAFRNSPIRLTGNQQRLLQLKNIPVTEFFADKTVMALLGAAVPLLIGGFSFLVLGFSPSIPSIAAIVLLVLGWFVPDLMLHRAGKRAKIDAGEALFTYFDLVTLERLANRSASQSMHAAASVSTAPLFGLITEALDRARLEQRAPYGELKRLATHLDLPELSDIADVMRLDESGAALAGALRARVRELRDAHLTAAKVAANQISERMTVFMVIPAMVFGVIFLVPPLLRLMNG